MNKNWHSIKIQNWVGNSALFETISDRDKVETIIRDIDNKEGKINIEIFQFISTFTFYAKLNEKRLDLIKKISSSDNTLIRSELIHELEKTEQEQKIFLKNVLQTAHSFTEIELRGQLELSAEFFFKGDINKSNISLNLDRLDQDQNSLFQYIKEIQHLEHAYDKLEDNANEFKIKAQLTILDLEISNPEDRLQKSIFFFNKGNISAKTTKRELFIADFSSDQAFFLQDNKQIKYAEPLFKEALVIYKKIHNQESSRYSIDLALALARTLNNLALLNFQQNNYVDSSPKYEEALKIYQQLAKELPNVRTYILTIKMNLALLYFKQNAFQQAKSQYEEIISIYRDLVNNAPLLYEKNLAHALNLYAILIHNMNDYSNAQIYYAEAIAIQQRLVNDGQTAILPQLAMSLQNYGILYYTMNMLNESQILQERALEIRRDLAKTSPHIFLSEIAQGAINLGIIHYKKEELDEAEKYFEESLKIYRELVHFDSQTYLFELTRVTHNLGILSKSKGNFNKSKLFFEETLKIRRQLLQTNQLTYIPELITTLDAFASLCRMQDDLSQAQVLYDEASSLALQLSEEDPDIYAPYIATIFTNIAMLNCQKKEYEQGEVYLERALQLYQRLSEDNLQAFLPEIANVSKLLSIFYFDCLPNKGKSLFYMKETLLASIPFYGLLPSARTNEDTVNELLIAWRVDSSNFYKDVMKEYSIIEPLLQKRLNMK